MLQEEQDVKQEGLESSTNPQEGVTQEPEAEVAQQPDVSATPEETPAQPQLEGGQPQVDVDEMGVPYKNRFMEYKRKYEELHNEIESLKQQLAQPQQQRKYSIQELELIAQENPEYRPWVEAEKAKILKEELLKATEEKLKQTEQQRLAEIKKQQSLQYVMQTYPEAFKKDAQGRPVGWDNSNPLTQQIAQLMQDPRFANDPEGLIAAADIAYARYMRQQTPKIQQQIRKAEIEKRQLQKKTLVEGGGTPVQEEISGVRKKVEQVKQTGSVRDASEAMKEIFKAKGVITE